MARGTVSHSWFFTAYCPCSWEAAQKLFNTNESRFQRKGGERWLSLRRGPRDQNPAAHREGRKTSRLLTAEMRKPDGVPTPMSQVTSNRPASATGSGAKSTATAQAQLLEGKTGSNFTLFCLVTHSADAGANSRVVVLYKPHCIWPFLFHDPSQSWHKVLHCLTHTQETLRFKLESPFPASLPLKKSA